MRFIKYILLFASLAEASISRDSFGVPIIQGESLQEVAKSIGFAQAEDRLWQIFFIVETANGRASKYFGKDFLSSDILQRQLNYTDEEVKDQINNHFTPRTKDFYESFLKGLNGYVDFVNAHISKLPYELSSLGFGEKKILSHFTLYDILRANQFILQQFSPTSIPSFQLDNYADLKLLIERVGEEKAWNIFNDLNPTAEQIKSPYTIVSGPHITKKSKPLSPHLGLQEPAQEAAALAQRLHMTKKLLHQSGVPTTGSSGQAISAGKSLSGNPLIRIAPQPNFNHPSDFYQIRIELYPNGFRANYFTIPTFPITPNGVFNAYGVGVQVGHLPSNDFLFETSANAVQQRIETIEVLNAPSIALPIYRSTTGGWVLTDPTETETILTLRSPYIGRQLQALNAFIESAFANTLEAFQATLLNPRWQSDILLLEGDYADAANIAAFHTGGWTKLPASYDRRLPQGVLSNPIPSNSLYSPMNPLFDANTKQGYYTGWNSLFSHDAQGSCDTIAAIGVNRMFWLDQYIRRIPRLTFEDLKNIGIRQSTANSNIPFDNQCLDEDADLFHLLFKERFFAAVSKAPTPERMEALAFLKNFQGDWFDNDTDVSDRHILASVWLNAVANAILNPFIKGTTREVGTATSSDPCPTLNPAGKRNNLTSQANTLSRIFGLAYDNTLFFDGWLDHQPEIDTIIIQGLDFALKTLQSQAWGKGKRAAYAFKNLVLGTVKTMPMCNTSGCIMVAEFTPAEIKMESALALGESGEVLGSKETGPKFNPHCFDQQEIFSQLRLRPNVPFQGELP